MSTVTDLLLSHAERAEPGLLFEDRRFSGAEHGSRCARYAAALRELRRPGAPLHVGVLADNRPEVSFLLGGCALAGAVLVGLNPVRRGAALARDVRLADCGLVLAEDRYRPLLDGQDLGGATVWPLGDPPWTDLLAAAPPVDGPLVQPSGSDLLMLVFTSGTSGDPKAVRCTHEKIAAPGRMLAERFGLTPRDTVYLAMPMFHSNAIMAGWSVGLAAGATLAIRRRFSASGFLPDVRRFGATYANYVGRPLSYVLATARRADDAVNPLRVAYGNEGSPADLAAFAERFGCRVWDGFGSSEGGVSIPRTPDTPPGALGPLPEDVRILSEDGKACPPARFGADGAPANPGEAIGELVNVAGAGAFAGYYNDPDADAARMRGGRYHSGDLAYADGDGYCYFAGRAGDWLRVDGENLGTAPIERVLVRFRGFAEVAVYAVPDPNVGDRVMAAVTLRDGEGFDAGDFAEFLGTQPDLGPKQHPEFVRLCCHLPKTATFKISKRELAAEGTRCGDPVWRRVGSAYERSPAQPPAGLSRA